MVGGHEIDQSRAFARTGGNELAPCLRDFEIKIAC